MSSKEAVNTVFLVFGSTRTEIDPESTVFEAGALSTLLQILKRICHRFNIVAQAKQEILNWNLASKLCWSVYLLSTGRVCIAAKAHSIKGSAYTHCDRKKKCLDLTFFCFLEITKKLRIRIISKDKSLGSFSAASNANCLLQRNVCLVYSKHGLLWTRFKWRKFGG